MCIGFLRSMYVSHMAWTFLSSCYGKQANSLQMLVMSCMCICHSPIKSAHGLCEYMGHALDAKKILVPHSTIVTFPCNSCWYAYKIFKRKPHVLELNIDSIWRRIIHSHMMNTHLPLSVHEWVGKLYSQAWKVCINIICIQPFLSNQAGVLLTYKNCSTVDKPCWCDMLLIGLGMKITIHIFVLSFSFQMEHRSKLIRQRPLLSLLLLHTWSSTRRKLIRWCSATPIPMKTKTMLPAVWCHSLALEKPSLF